MKDHIYKNIEITGSSDVGTDEAIRKAILKASETRNKQGLVQGFRSTWPNGRWENSLLAGDSQD